MAARPIANGVISFGLVSIPVKLFAATRSKSVSFRLLHAKDKSRIQQKFYCPVDDAIVERNELVRGFEVEKGVFVTFTDEELEKLEAHDGHALDIKEFVPLAEVDPIYFDTAYHLGCEPESARAYRLLAQAMHESKRVALGTFTMRYKEYLVLLRPYEKGLMLHTMYFADEIVAATEIGRGEEAKVGEGELALAKRLVDDLTENKFHPEKYKDSYRERVIEAARKKVQGEEMVEVPAEERRAKVIDLMSALKASLARRGAPAEEEPQGKPREKRAAVAGHARARAARPRKTK